MFQNIIPGAMTHGKPSTLKRLEGLTLLVTACFHLFPTRLVNLKQNPERSYYLSTQSKDFVSWQQLRPGPKNIREISTDNNWRAVMIQVKDNEPRIRMAE